MESVEIWMWVIAGLLFTGILLAGAYKFMSNYTRNADVKTAQESFAKMTTMADRVCAGGISASEEREIIFPYIVKNISMSGTGEFSDEICMTLGDEKPSCYIFDYCNASLTPKSIDLTQKTDFFRMIQTAISGAPVASFRVKAKKVDYRNVTISLQRIVSKD